MIIIITIITSKLNSPQIKACRKLKYYHLPCCNKQNTVESAYSSFSHRGKILIELALIVGLPIGNTYKWQIASSLRFTCNLEIRCSPVRLYGTTRWATGLVMGVYRQDSSKRPKCLIAGDQSTIYQLLHPSIMQLLSALTIRKPLKVSPSALLQLAAHYCQVSWRLPDDDLHLIVGFDNFQKHFSSFKQSN